MSWTTSWCPSLRRGATPTGFSRGSEPSPKRSTRKGRESPTWWSLGTECLFFLMPFSSSSFSCSSECFSSRRIGSPTDDEAEEMTLGGAEVGVVVAEAGAAEAGEDLVGAAFPAGAVVLVEAARARAGDACRKDIPRYLNQTV